MGHIRFLQHDVVSSLHSAGVKVSVMDLPHDRSQDYFVKLTGRG